MNYINNRFLLQKRPTGMPEDNCWIMDSQKITELQKQEILIKAEYLSIDPYMRGKMNDSISYTPPLKIGEVMVGESVGRVIESKSKNYAVGDLVTVHQGWQTYIRTKDSDPSSIHPPDLVDPRNALSLTQQEYRKQKTISNGSKPKQIVPPWNNSPQNVVVHLLWRKSQALT